MRKSTMGPILSAKPVIPPFHPYKTTIPWPTSCLRIRCFPSPAPSPTTNKCESRTNKTIHHLPVGVGSSTALGKLVEQKPRRRCWRVASMWRGHRGPDSALSEKYRRVSDKWRDPVWIPVDQWKSPEGMTEGNPRAPKEALLGCGLVIRLDSHWSNFAKNDRVNPLVN